MFSIGWNDTMWLITNVAEGKNAMKQTGIWT